MLIGELLAQQMGGVCWGHNNVIAVTPNTIPNAHVVSSANCPGASDGLHFTAEGYRMIGKRYAEKMLQLLDKTAEIDFDTSETYFPLKKEAFNPSLYYQGTMSAAASFISFTPETNGGIGGWRYSKGIDLSEYNYLVVNLMRTASCKPVVKIYDTDDVLNPCYNYELTSKEAVIDLHNMTDANGKTIDPSHIYMVGFQATGSQALYINKVFVSLDGTTPVSTSIEDVTNDKTTNNGIYYDLSGRKVQRPTKGIYLINGKKVLVK